MVDINGDFNEGMRATELAEHLFDVEVDLLACATQQLEPLNSSDATTVQGQKFETQLDDHVLHRIVTRHEVHETRCTVVFFGLARSRRSRDCHG